MNDFGPIRLLLDDALPGTRNMAIDEALLESALVRPERGATLRFYRWAEPTLSLGYFQAFDQRPENLRPLACVRRLSGGGAIVHDRELTYSLVVPPGKWPRQNHLDLVDDVHRACAIALGLVTEPTTNHSVEQQLEGNGHAAAEPFLCFLRRSPRDLVLRDAKVLGSAQRTRRGAILQHGSLLLRHSASTPQLRGVAELQREPKLDDFVTRVTALLSQTWKTEFLASALDEYEEHLAQTLETDRYASSEWTQLR